MSRVTRYLTGDLTGGIICISMYLFLENDEDGCKLYAQAESMLNFSSPAPLKLEPKVRIEVVRKLRERERKSLVIVVAVTGTGKERPGWSHPWLPFTSFL